MNAPPAPALRRAWIAAIVAYAVVLRLCYAARVELLPEEAYYWNYSRHLDIGYLDHPPLVAWLIRLGTTVFGNTVFGVRAGALCCGAVTMAFVYRTAKNLFGAGANAVPILLQVLPFFFLAGLLMTPDAPLTAAWAASVYFLERALIGGRPRAWLWFGVSIGVGLVSKYTIVLLGFGAVVFMVLDAPSRRWFARWEPYAAIALAALVFSPVLAWNAEHEWASFAFQTSRRLAEPARFSVHKLVASAMVLLTPVGLAAAAAALVRAEHPLRAWRLQQCAVLVPLAVFAVFSVRHEVKLDWTGAPWTAIVPLLSVGLVRARHPGAGGRRWLRVAWPPTIGVMLAVYGAGFFYLGPGIPGVGYSGHTELLPVAWREFARQIDGIADGWRASHPGRLLVVGMDRYAIASELAFYSADQGQAVANTSSAHLFGDMGLMYERWFPAAQQAGHDLLLVAWDRDALADAHLQDRVAALQAIHEGVLVRDGKEVRRYYYRFGSDYKYP